MAAAPKYKWRVRYNDEVTLYDVNPVWKDDLSIEYAAEGGEQFLRPQLSSKIDFVGKDYDLIMGFFTTSFSATIYVFLRKSDNNGVSYDNYWYGKFNVTDCTVNVDDKKITVQPKVVDLYTDVLNGMDKEYDIIKLTPAIQPIVVRKRPMIQIFTSGDKVVNCIVGQEAFEVDGEVPSVVDNEQEYMTEDCHFAVVKDSTELNFVDPLAGFEQPFTGVLQDGEYLDNSTGTYRIKYFEELTISLDTLGTTVYDYKNGLRVYNAADLTAVLWHYEQRKTAPWPVGYDPLPIEIIFEKDGGGDPITCIRHSVSIYMRIVTNVDAFQDQPTYQIAENDIVAYNRNYKRCISYLNYNGEIVQSTSYSVTPTEWGRRDDGTYFVQPVAGAMPIGRSTWVNTSFWFVPSQTSRDADLDGTDAYLLKDAFPLWSVISVLLQQFSNVTFSNTSTYSQFLYGGNDPIGNNDMRLFLTPKSNITAGEYQTPAQKGLITLRSILTMLKNTLQLYWHIDSNGRFRIEHIKYYRQGMSYSSNPGIGIDLTSISVVRNGKKWSFGTNEYTFDKVDMPATYQFSWMDVVTRAFMGNPIEVNSAFVQQDRVEEVSVGDYTSDVDYMLLNPGAVSQEGFALMTIEPANVLDRTNYPPNAATGYTLIGSIGSAFRGKRVTMYYQITGSQGGTATLCWVQDGEIVESNLSFVLPITGNDQVIIPDNATGVLLKGDMMTTTLRMVPSDMVQLPIVTPAGTQERLQNGLLAFLTMQNPYWMWDMPAKTVKVNGTTVNVSGVMRKKKQTVNVPVGNFDPDMLQLVKTGIGNGTIEKMEINLSSRMAKTTLKYDTEQ